MAVNKTATRTSNVASMKLLALMLLASVVSARRHHSGAREADGNAEKAHGDGPAWEARKNSWTKGTDLLDWSRDPRRVDPKVYTYRAICPGHTSNWAYSMTGQLEGQEMPAGLVKGSQVEPRSKAQLVLCQGGRPYIIEDMPTEAVKRYLTENELVLERELPFRACVGRLECPRWAKDCITYRLDDPEKAENINGPISGSESGRIEHLLRDYGPMAVFTSANFTLQEDGFLNPDRDDMDRVAVFGKRDNFLLVGYGRTDDGVGYFKFKTSRGPGWGHGGYGYFKYTSGGQQHLYGFIELWKIKPCPLHKRAHSSKTTHH